MGVPVRSLWLVSMLASVIPLDAAPIVLSGVPAYNWYHGCGPTAAASVLGYWDLHGFPDLFEASGADLFWTWNVQDEISSPEHNAKYDSTPDDPNLPEPPDTSIADFFHTSELYLDFGWSYQSAAASALAVYAAYRGYHFLTYSDGYWNLDFQRLAAEIDAGRPMLVLVDTDGDGETDHFVPVLGYDNRGPDGLWYGLYTTWREDELVEWEPFAPIAAGQPWGIGYCTYAVPLDTPAPEPATAGLALVPLALWLTRRARRRGSIP